jgi:hypothetical protein
MPGVMTVIRPAIENGALTLPEIIKIRNRGYAKKFRQWLHATKARDPRELEQAYVQALGSKLSSKLPIRLLRLFITAGVGILEPITGIIASASDNLFIDKWLKGYSPKLFLEKLRALPLNDLNPDE